VAQAAALSHALHHHQPRTKLTMTTMTEGRMYRYVRYFSIFSYFQCHFRLPAGGDPCCSCRFSSGGIGGFPSPSSTSVATPVGRGPPSFPLIHAVSTTAGGHPPSSLVPSFRRRGFPSPSSTSVATLIGHHSHSFTQFQPQKVDIPSLVPPIRRQQTGIPLFT